VVLGVFYFFFEIQKNRKKYSTSLKEKGNFIHQKNFFFLWAIVALTIILLEFRNFGCFFFSEKFSKEILQMLFNKIFINFFLR